MTKSQATNPRGEAMFFEEKSRQLSVSGMDAFSIPISSRYARADELSEMLMFAKEVARLGLQNHVKNVFYDTPACLCVIEINDDTDWYDDEGVAIKACAEKTIAQFQWAGCVYHRNDTANLLEEIKRRLETSDSDY